MSEHTIYQMIVLLCATQGVKSGIEHLPAVREIKGGAAWVLYVIIAALWWVVLNSLKVEYFSAAQGWLVFFAVPGLYSLIAKFRSRTK